MISRKLSIALVLPLLLGAIAQAAPPTYRLDWVRNTAGGLLQVNESGQVLTTGGGSTEVYTAPGVVESFTASSFNALGLLNGGATWSNALGQTIGEYNHLRRSPGGNVSSSPVVRLGRTSLDGTIYGGVYNTSQQTVFRTIGGSTEIASVTSWSSGSALFVNDAGFLAGQTNVSTNPINTAWIWRPGSAPLTLSNTVPGEAGGRVTVLDLNAAGQLLVSIQQTTGAIRPVVWNANGESFIPATNRTGFRFEPSAMNSSGIYGASFREITTGNGGDGGLVTPEGGYLFSEMTFVGDSAAGWRMNAPRDISEGGIIVGEAVNLSLGTSRTYRLTPVPEPASLVALGIGAVAILRRRRGR